MEDKNGHRINAHGEIVFDKRCQKCLSEQQKRFSSSHPIAEKSTNRSVQVSQYQYPPKKDIFEEFRDVYGRGPNKWEMIAMI